MRYKEGDLLTVKFKIKVLEIEAESDKVLVGYEDGGAGYVSKSELDKYIIGVLGGG